MYHNRWTFENSKCIVMVHNVRFWLWVCLLYHCCKSSVNGKKTILEKHVHFFLSFLLCLCLSLFLEMIKEIGDLERWLRPTLDQSNVSESKYHTQTYILEWSTHKELTGLLSCIKFDGSSSPAAAEDSVPDIWASSNLHPFLATNLKPS